MNSGNDPLDRLLKSAARAPRPETGAARFALEARVLAGWRASEPADNGDYLIAWLRRAAICACVLAVASLAWNYSVLAGGHTGGGELAVADATMRTGVEP
jgi:hypothetical protein